MKRYLFGNFDTGTLVSNDEFPVIKNSESVTIDINSGDNGTIKVSKDALINPNEWEKEIAVFDNFIALEDTTKAWDHPHAILFAGFFNKVSGNIGEALTSQVTGLREYLSARVVNGRASGVQTDPTAGVTFQASNYQGLMKEVALHAFTQPAGARPTPAVLRNADGDVSGDAVKYEALEIDAMTYSAIMDQLRDIESPGNEYYFKPKWADASKNKVVWDLIIGSDAQPHINFDKEYEVALGSLTVKQTAFGKVINSEGMANRIIGQSKSGDDEAKNGADITVKSVNAGPRILVDSTFNPGVELTEAEMEAQLSSRLDYALKAKGESTYTVVEPDASVWMDRLGAKLVFKGTNNSKSSGYDITVRCVSLTFSASSDVIEIGVMVPQPRYPKLPNNRKNSGSAGNGFGNTIGGRPIGGVGGGKGTGRPVNNKPMPNAPIPGGIPGGGGEGLPDFSTPDIPTENKDIFDTPITVEFENEVYINPETVFKYDSVSSEFPGQYLYALNVSTIQFGNDSTAAEDSTTVGPDIVVSKIDFRDLESDPIMFYASPQTSSVLPFSRYQEARADNLPIVIGTDQKTMEVMNAALFAVNGRVYIHLHSIKAIKFTNVTTNKKQIHYKSKSTVYSIDITFENGDFGGDWRKESWFFNAPTGQETFFTPTSQMLVHGYDSAKLSAFQGYFVPRDGKVTPLDYNGTSQGVIRRTMAWSNNFSSGIEGGVIKTYMTGPPFNGKEINKNWTNAVGCASDGRYIYLANQSSADKQYQIFNTQTKSDMFQFYENAQVKLDTFPIPESAIQYTNQAMGTYGTCAVVAGWFINMAPSKDAKESAIIRTKDNIQEVLKSNGEGFVSNVANKGADFYWALNTYSINGYVKGEKAGISNGDYTNYIGIGNLLLAVGGGGPAANNKAGMSYRRIKPEYRQE